MWRCSRSGCCDGATPWPAAGATTALRDTLVQRFRALLEIHLRQHQPLGFYADALHVTPDHLSRACRSVTGLSALELMHDRMALEARRLLAYTNAQVGEVAAELGFTDPAYFSRFFARRAGGSPQAYRAALQQRDGGAALICSLRPAVAQGEPGFPRALRDAPTRSALKGPFELTARS